jgi:hypothetical protein
MHRLHALGHDPLIGLAVGVFDIIRHGVTILDATGKLHFLKNLGDGVYNPFEALFLHLGHLLSDAFTPMGIPAPGWGLLNIFSNGPTVPVGEGKERTIGELAQVMYRQGYDLRHFLTMATATAAVEIILAAYIIFRTHADEGFRESQEKQIIEAGGQTYLSSERYTAMSLLAHLAVASSNGVRIACQGPLALNYPQWLRFIQALIKWVKRRVRNPSNVLMPGLDHNARLLFEGWSAIATEEAPLPQAAD